MAEHMNSSNNINQWVPSSEWVYQWKSKLPLQTIMRLLQVLVPQVEKICIDKSVEFTALFDVYCNIYIYIYIF